MQDTSTRAAEVSAVRLRLSHLVPESAERFLHAKASHRFLSFIGKQLVIYGLDDKGVPENVRTLVCKDVYLEGNMGMASKWELSTGEVFEFSHTPVEITTGVFMWHTFNSTLHLGEHKGESSVRFSMLYACPKHPLAKESGVTYIQERAAYDLEY